MLQGSFHKTGLRTSKAAVSSRFHNLLKTEIGTGLEQSALELQYIAIRNSNPVLEWPLRLHSGLECSAMIAINHDCIIPESENRIQLIPVRCRFRLIRIVTLKADLWDAVTESGISCVRIVDRTAMKINDPM